MSRKATIIMTMLVGTIAFFALIAVSVVTTKKDKELQFLHVISRHGERTPADTYPNDPYINETFFPVGWGQLTIRGKGQVYAFGQFLRDRYKSFLPEYYSPEVYYTQSTDSDRTKATLQLLNAGIWPPTGEQKWGPIDWQPIPIHSEPLNKDSLLLVRNPCPQYHIEFERVLQLPEVQEKLKKNEELFKYLSEHTGKEITSFDDVQDVHSTLKAEESFNLTLPEWTKGYYPEKTLEPTIYSFVLNAYTDKLIRLKGGVLLKKLLSDWKSVADGTMKPKERKAFLYGGHDSTIANILRALHVWDPQIPGYGIAILLEFSRDTTTNDFGLEIYLRNGTCTDFKLHQLSIPNCGTFCPLAKLEELSKSVISEDWDQECKTDIEGFTVPPLSGP